MQAHVEYKLKNSIRTQFVFTIYVLIIIINTVFESYSVMISGKVQLCLFRRKYIINIDLIDVF